MSPTRILVFDVTDTLLSLDGLGPLFRRLLGDEAVTACYTAVLMN